MSWRVQVTDGLDQAGIDLLEQQAEVLISSDLQQLAESDAVIVRGATRMERGLIEGARPRLRVIGRAGVGVDNIDLIAAAENQVVVVNAPLAATNAVAEHAIGLMFALARHVPRADAALKEGGWPKKELKGSELEGKTLGVIGMGRIGAALAAKAVALGMHVVGYDPPLSTDQIAERGAEPVELEAMLARSDYISLHVPLLPETKGLLGAEELARAKPGLRLVSTARGGVVDERALLAALESGQVAGAALDVFEHEPPGDTPLVRHPQVVATPHLGAQTREAQVRAAVDIAEEVLAALADKSLRWRVA